MEVYVQDIIEELKELKQHFYRETGRLPTHVEMTAQEYDLLKEQITVKYSIRHDFDTVNPNEEKRSIFDMIIKVKG